MHCLNAYYHHLRDVTTRHGSQPLKIWSNYHDQKGPQKVANKLEGKWDPPRRFRGTIAEGEVLFIISFISQMTIISPKKKWSNS